MVIQKWKVQGSPDSPFGTVCDSDRHAQETLMEGRKGTALAESNQAQSKMNFLPIEMTSLLWVITMSNI